jgi:hypothetical protein
VVEVEVAGLTRDRRLIRAPLARLVVEGLGVDVVPVMGAYDRSKVALLRPQRPTFLEGCFAVPLPLAGRQQKRELSYCLAVLVQMHSALLSCQRHRSSPTQLDLVLQRASSFANEIMVLDIQDGAKAEEKDCGEVFKAREMNNLSHERVSQTCLHLQRC